MAEQVYAFLLKIDEINEGPNAVYGSVDQNDIHLK